jgi:hypothetical protein
MPITPRFSISQTDTNVLLDIRVPHVRVTTDSSQVALSSADVEPSLLRPDQEPACNVLHFSSAPYLLMLNFEPNRFHESSAEECATYEPTIENGTVRLSLRKEKPGVFWENLDLVGRMAQPKKGRAAAPTNNWLKEVINSETDDEITELDVGHDSETMQEQRVLAGSYGFLRMFSGIFTDLGKDGLAQEMLEMPWDETKNKCRLVKVHENDDEIA